MAGHVSHKNLVLVYDLALHKFPIGQWLEHSTNIWKVMGSTHIVVLRKTSFLHSTWEHLEFIYFTLSESAFHLSFIHT